MLTNVADKVVTKLIRENGSSNNTASNNQQQYPQNTYNQLALQQYAPQPPTYDIPDSSLQQYTDTALTIEGTSVAENIRSDAADQTPYA